MPIKLLLLVIAMAMFGLNTYAQTGKSVKVANDQQLTEAMQNASIGTIELAPGYYAYLDVYAESGTKVVKSYPDNGSRSDQCLYFIIGKNVCFEPDVDGFVLNLARAGYSDPFSCFCCPTPDLGIWSVISKPDPGATVNFLDPLNEQIMNFEVDMPGAYILRYTWGAPYNSLVETEFLFYGPVTVELSAPDVCGLSTLVSYVRSSDYEDPGTTVVWTLNGAPYAGPEFSDDFTLTVPWCGYWELSVTVTPDYCPPVTETIWIDFSCQPTADAGDDAYLCYEWCYFSLVGGTGLGTWSPNHAFSWVQIGGPGELVFANPNSPAYDSITSVCAYPIAPDTCRYGEYEVAFQIQNGQCYSEDFKTLIFYEQPEADAGEDFILCEEFCFTLNATPYPYCGAYGVNHWGQGWWELVSQPGNCTVTFDMNDPNAYVCITACLEGCEYGDYIFVWHEVNVKYNDAGTPLWSDQHCVASDEVVVTIYEQPVADAGDDFWACVDAYMTPYTYMMDASGYGREDYCYTMYGMWTKSCGPGDVTFMDIYDPNSIVYFHQPGRYIFNWSLWNEACEDEAEVLYDLLEQPEALAEITELEAVCDLLCIDLTYAYVAKYEYFGTDLGDCPNYWDRAHWILIEGPDGVDPLQAQFADDTDPQTTLCVSWYGGYTIGWVELNKPDDKDYYCSDTVLIYVEFFETPTPDAGDDATICDNCYTLNGTLHEYLPPPNQHGQDFFEWRLSEWPGCNSPYLTNVNSPSGFGFYGDYPATGASFGPQVFSVFGGVELVNDGSANPTLGCDLLIGFTPGQIALIDRGSCLFVTKVLNAQAAGAIGVIIANSTPGADPVLMGGAGPSITIPVVMVSYETGQIIKSDLSGQDPVYATISQQPLVIIADPHSAVTQVCLNPEFDDACGTYYGTYCFELFQSNGDCEGSDYVAITFNKEPDPLPLAYTNDSNCDDYPWNYGNNISRGFDYGGCIDPGEVIEVCADGCTEFTLLGCETWFNTWEECFFGWTFEWSVTGPAGMSYTALPGYYEEGYGWHLPYLEVCWGECCDTARIYLTITTPDCEVTYEYKVYVNHKPCADLQGPDVAEVGMIETYCYCEPPTDDDCLLYTWTVEHCGEIVGGQGTPCVDVLWTDYNINDGWGRVTVSVLDTCTGCCNYDEMMVKVYPSGTIGEYALYGYVYYHNNIMTPLNGVEVQLWNSGIPVMSTASFNDIEGGMGMGYYVFPNVNGMTEFDITATYAAPWYGANATDALAVELKVVNSLPMGFVYDDVVEAAMDVNNSTTITALDALWIKQRAIGMVNYFPAGNWAFADMSASAGDSPYDVMTLNVGDANRSNIPNSMKAAPAIDLIADGVMNVVTGEEFLLPIRIAEASQFGAITLDLGFNSSALEVLDVIAPEGMVTHINNGNVSIAWSSLNPMVLAANDAVITLKVIAIGEVTASDMFFNIGMNSEFASPAATVIEPVTLKTYGISTSPAAEDYFLSTNRPNPFSTTTFIEYTLPETGKVRLSVLDMLGQEIAVLVESTQTAGSYTVEFKGTGLATGVYLYKITVDGETRDYISTQRMVISH